MAEPNYQKIAESLVENASDSSLEQSLDDQTVFDSVKKLCESSKSGQFFVDATSKIEDETTKNRLIARLNWVNDSVNAMAVKSDSKIEMTKPFQLAAIGMAATVFIWIAQKPPISELQINYLLISAVYVTILTLVRKNQTVIRDKNRKISTRIKSLLDTVRNVGVS